MTRRMNPKVAMLGVVFASLTTFSLSGPCAMAQAQNTLNKLEGSYSFRMTPAKSFSADAPGDPGSLALAPRQDILRVGVFTSDGNGNLSGHTIATTDTNNGQTGMVTFDWTGKYTVDSNGTGFFSVDQISNLVCTDTTVTHSGPTPHPATPGGTPFAGNTVCPTGDQSIEGHEDYAFVFSTTGGKNIEFIQTDNSGGGAKIFLAGAAHHRGSLAGKSDDENNESDNGNGNGNGNGRD